jgi:hypothetical protein
MNCANKNIRLLIQKFKSRSLVFDLIGTTFFLLGIYLIYNEFMLYLKERPTHLTHQEIEIQPSHIPIIRICLQPGLDLNQLTSTGYETLYSYFAGFETEEEIKFIGWKGNSNRHPSDFLEHIAIVKNASNLIESAKFYGRSDEKLDGNVQLEKAMYPYGQRISITLPSQLADVIYLEIVFKFDFIRENNIEDVKVFLQDPQIAIKSKITDVCLDR